MVANPEDFEFIIERDYAVPRERMFELWTDPAHIQHWLGPKDATMSRCTGEVREGGVLRYALSLPGTPEFYGAWTFRKVVVPERLEFIVSFVDETGTVVEHPFSPGWPLYILSVVTFAAVGEATRIRISWRAHDATADERRVFSDGRDSMTMGWTGTFERLDIYLEKVK